MGVRVIVTDFKDVDLSKKDHSGVLFQYPDTEGRIGNFSALVEDCRKGGVRTALGLVHTWGAPLQKG